MANLIILLYLNSKSYKNEYYKRIIDKRLNAYETLEKLVSHSKAIWYSPNDERPFLSFFNNVERYEQFKVDLRELSRKSFYLSNEMQFKISDLGYFLFENIPPNVSDEKIKEFGKSYYDKIDELFEQFHDLLFRDLEELYDVRKFLKNRSIQSVLRKKGKS